MRQIKLTNQIKGDGLFYKPHGLLGKLITLFVPRFSHVSLALSLEDEFDAAVENKGVSVNKIDWTRHPIIVPLPFDKAAYAAALAMYENVEYGEMQVISKAFKSKWFLIRDKTDCAETYGYYISQHVLYRVALGEGRIPRKLMRKIADPSSMSPYDCYRVTLILSRSGPVSKYIVHGGKDA